MNTIIYLATVLGVSFPSIAADNSNSANTKKIAGAENIKPAIKYLVKDKITGFNG